MSAMPQGGVQPHKPGSLDPKKIAMIGAGALAVLFLIMRSGSSSSSGVSASQEQSDIAAAQQAQQQADEAAYGSSSAGYGSTGGGTDPDTADLSAINQSLSGIQTSLGSINTGATGSGGAPVPVTVTNPTPVTIDYPSPSSNGQASPQQAAPSVSSGNPFAGADAPFLAPGATAPNYALVRPKGAPAGSVWSGSKSPGSNYKGVGGGWWVKK